MGRWHDGNKSSVDRTIMSGPNEETPLQFLEVTNHLDMEIEMRFHGEPYHWKPGESVNCSTEAAAHIFGYGCNKEGRISAFLRLGWICTNPGCDYAGAMNKLAKISFRPVEQVFQMPTGAERKERGRRRRKSSVSGSDRPLTAAGEASGGAEDSSEPSTAPTGTESDEPLF